MNSEKKNSATKIEQLPQHTVSGNISKQFTHGCVAHETVSINKDLFQTGKKNV